MTERESLYAAICAHPRADLPKLVFADWLDEQGDAVDRARAEMIRIQCEWEANARGYERALEPYWLDRWDRDGEWGLDTSRLMRADPIAGRAQALLLRAGQLETSAMARPPMPFPIIPGASARFPGPIPGLRTELRVSLKRTWERRMGEIATRMPLRDLTLNPAYGNGDGPWLAGAIEGAILANVESLTQRKHSSPLRLSELLSRPELVHLRRIALNGNPFGEGIFDALAEGEHLGGLEEIELVQLDHLTGDTPSGIHRNIVRKLRRWRVCSAGSARRYRGLPWILPFVEQADAQLEELGIEWPSDADDIATILGRGAGGLVKLQSLAISGGDLTARGACDLLATDQLPELRHLDVGGSILGDLVGRRLELAKDYPKLHSLELRISQLSAFGIAALLRWPGFAGLRKLVLSGNAINHSAMRALASAEAPHLRTLGLANCKLHDSHLRELVSSPLVRSLWTLDLRGNAFEDSAGRVLAESPFLDALQRLILDLPEDDPNLAPLRNRFGERLQLG